MAYVTKKTGGSKWGEFAATAVKTLSNIPKDVQDWKQKEKEQELRLAAFEQQKAQLAQEMQARQIEMTEKAYSMQGGAQWNIAASDTPKEASKAWYQRVKQYAPFTGDQRDEKTYIDQSVNTAAIIGKDRAQRVLKGPSMVSRVDLTPETHQKHYQQALADLQFASDYQDPKEIAAMRKILVDADEKYQTHQSAIKTAQIRANENNKVHPREKRLANEQVIREVNKFEASADIKPLKETLTSGTKAQALLNQGNLTNAVEPVKIMLAAAFNQGRPTDRDAEAMAQNPSIMQAVKRFTTTKAFNQDSKSDREQFSVLAGALIDWSKKRYTSRVNEWASGTAGLLNLTEDELAGIALNRGGLSGNTNVAPSASAPSNIMKDPKTGKRYEVDPTTKKVIREVP